MAKDIIASRPGNVLGQWYEKGEIVPHSVEQIWNMMPPYSDQLRFARRQLKAKEAPAEDKAKAK